jgi:hypothetical protein
VLLINKKILSHIKQEDIITYSLTITTINAHYLPNLPVQRTMTMMISMTVTSEAPSHNPNCPPILLNSVANDVDAACVIYLLSIVHNILFVLTSVYAICLNEMSNINVFGVMSALDAVSLLSANKKPNYSAEYILRIVELTIIARL